MNYDEFLHSKIEVAPVSGFEVRKDDINTALKPHQRDAVMWAVKGGRRALFEAFGLGKTVQELEWCRLVQEHEQRPHRFDRLREDNQKEWEFWMYRCVTDPETGEKYGWGRVLDYLGVEWENKPGAILGQVTMEDL